MIESPELEQQYAAAVTDLEHKRRNLARSQELLAKGNTTQVAMLQFETDVARGGGQRRTASRP